MSYVRNLGIWGNKACIKDRERPGQTHDLCDTSAML